MPVLELTATVPGDVAGEIDAFFEACGECVVTIGEADGTPARFGEPGMPVEDVWALCEVSVLVPEIAPGIDLPEGANDQASLVAAASAALGVAFDVKPLADPDRDWLAHYRDQVEPLAFAGGLKVVPPWIEPPAAAARVIVLEPDQAFGSGRHPTTRMCLDALPDRVPGATVLDYGAGSAILAMAAVLHGARAADAVEIDEVALECARANVARNGLLDRVRLYVPPAAPAIPYDLVLANILLNPLVTLAPTLSARIAPGGRVLMTGILAEQRATLTAAYPGFTFVDLDRDEDWLLVEGRRIDA